MKTFVPCHHCNAPIQAGLNRCPGCGQYNFYDSGTKDRKIVLSKVVPNPIPRLKSGPWDPCLGGGAITTSVSLLAGEPGAGKSTLLMQLAGAVAALLQVPTSVVYIATEEDEEQIKERADRLIPEQFQDYILLVDAMGGMNLTHLLEETKPKFVILDSLPGFTGQGTGKDEAIAIIRALKQYAKKNHAPAIVIDHITKDLDFAGYMSLMHAVDCLLMLRGYETIKLTTTERKVLEARGLEPMADGDYRVLTTEKNRHGPAPTRVIFTMTPHGLTPHLHKTTRTDS